jgi:hypothetical protein
MVVLIFSTPDGPHNKTILNTVLPALSDHQVEIYHSIRKLSDRLRQPLDGDIIGLFIAASHEELDELLSIRFLLRSIRIVLILSDRSEQTISAGHDLAPRFLSYVDGDINEVTAVLSKMIERDQRNVFVPDRKVL